MVIVLAAVLVAARLNLFSSGSESSGSRAQVALSPEKTRTSAVIEPTPTARPTPTATPIPAPVKKTSAADPLVSAAGAAVVDERSGAVIYEKNSRAQRAPASITKIVTALVAIERAKPGDMVNAQYDSAELIDSTLMGLYPRDRISLEDLLYGLMLPSGNDAALAIANHIAGSEAAFTDLMNSKMKELGLTDSHFVNAHGLDARGHYTSAYDMAMVSRYAMQSPLFRQLAAAKSHPVTLWRSGEKMSYDIYNLNKLLAQYTGADGIKIGYTENAGRTIVGSATRNGHRIYAAVLGSDDLWTDTPRLLDYVFQNFSWLDGN